jgi:hypothetical protein
MALEPVRVVIRVIRGLGRGKGWAYEEPRVRGIDALEEEVRRALCRRLRELLALLGEPQDEQVKTTASVLQILTRSLFSVDSPSSVVTPSIATFVTESRIRSLPSVGSQSSVVTPSIATFTTESVIGG